MLSPSLIPRNDSRFGSQNTSDFFNQQRGAAETHYVSMGKNNPIGGSASLIGGGNLSPNPNV